MNKKTLKLIIFVSVAIVFTLINNYLIHTNHQKLFLILLPLSLASMSFIFWRFNWFKLNEKNLFIQPLFIASILLPLYYFLMFGLWVWKEHQIELSSNGFMNFLTISKLPLLILALSVPLASIINNIHRTIQTEKQISEAQLKNKFDISINHIKYYTELFKKIESKEITENYAIKDPNNQRHTTYGVTFSPIIHYPSNLYKKIFSSETFGLDGSIKQSERFLTKLSNDWKHLNQCFQKLHKFDSALMTQKNVVNFRAVKCKIYFEICIAYETLCRTLELGDYRPEVSFIMEDFDNNYQIWIPFYNFQTLYNSIKIVEKISLQIFDIINVQNIEVYFPSFPKLFLYGPGAVHDWSYFMNRVTAMSGLPSCITDISYRFTSHS